MLAYQTQNANNIHATQNGVLPKGANLLDLRKSALFDETILQSGCYSASADETRKILGFDVGPGLVFPYAGVLTLDGRPFYRVKPDKPPIINGKPAKYLTPPGEGNYLYIPSNMSKRVLADASFPLVLAEGEKKALKGCQEGFPTIALPGVYCFKDKSHNPIPDFNSINWQGRLSYIAFDSYIVKNRMVQMAEWELGAILHQRGAIVVPLRFPHGNNGEEIKLDDYLILYGSGQLSALMEECKDSPLTRLLREEYSLGSVLATEGIDVKRGFDEKEPFYIITPLTCDLSIRIQNIKEKNGRITVDISAYQNQNLLTVDSINIMRERERKAFIKKMGLESEIERILLGKMNHLPRIAKELKQIQRLHREADDWVAKVVQQNIGTSTIAGGEREEALNLLKDPALLYRIGKAVERLGVAGERRNATTIYLVITSRILKNPISVLIKGESSSGKSFVPSQVIHLFPNDAYIELTGMSRQALVYSDEAISHRTIIIFEKHGMDQALYNIRTLQSEGKVIFETVQKDPETGKHKTERIEKEGPTNFIVTTTSLKIHHENETRNWSVDVDESDEQTEAVKKKIADKYSNIVSKNSFVNVFQNAQKLLKPYPVKIPFAEFLGARTPNRPIRIRRDFDKLLSAIEVITLLHQYQRPIKKEEGVEYLEATLADYFMAKELFNDLFIWSLSGTNRKTQKATSAVRNLYQKKNSPVTFKDLMVELGKTKQTIQTWLKPAIASGEVEVHDSKGKDPATFIPGVKGAIVSGLPGVEELAQAFPDWVEGFRVVHPLTGEEIVFE